MVLLASGFLCYSLKFIVIHLLLLLVLLYTIGMALNVMRSLTGLKCMTSQFGLYYKKAVCNLYNKLFIVYGQLPGV